MINKEIGITRQNDNYYLITDSVKGYERRLHQSLITDNKVDIIDNKITISLDLYRNWFRDSIVKNYNELCDLFYTNISLFIEKHDIILKDPRLYNIRSPKLWGAVKYSRGYFSTLGRMLFSWINDPNFSRRCECDGQAIIYHAGCDGNGKYAICLKCGKCDKAEKFPCKYYSSEELISHHIESIPWKPSPSEPVSIRELIKFLKNEDYIIDTSNKDNYEDIKFELTYGIWKKKIL